MPVVINELEIVLADEPAGPPPTGREDHPAEATTPSPVGPLEISHILERRAERELRILAH